MHSDTLATGQRDLDLDLGNVNHAKGAIRFEEDGSGCQVHVSGLKNGKKQKDVIIRGNTLYQTLSKQRETQIRTLIGGGIDKVSYKKT